MVENKPTKKQQTTRFTDKELKLMKSVFVDKDELLIAIRKVILQLELTEQEDILIKTVIKDDVAKLVRKVFLPTIDGNAPLHQVIDLMMTVKIEDKTPEEAKPHIDARMLMINYIDQQLCEFETKRDKIIIFNELSDNYIDLTARNTIVQHTEQMLAQIKIIAGTKEESEEEMMKRISADSSK